MSTKTCPTCKQSLPTERFFKNKAKKDGCSVYCKDCTRKRAVSVVGKNMPSRRKVWGDKMYDYLNISESDY